jgi:hypothetical protein
MRTMGSYSFILPLHYNIEVKKVIMSEAYKKLIFSYIIDIV